MVTTVRELILSAGGPTRVARALGVSRAAVWKWCAADRVAIGKTVSFGRLVGVSPQELRPDVFHEEADPHRISLGEKSFNPVPGPSAA